MGEQLKKTVVALSLSATLLTGCAAANGSTKAADAQPNPAKAATSPASVAATPAASPGKATANTTREDQVKAVYLESLRTSQPGLKAEPDASLITIAQGFCKMYDGGATSAHVNSFILKGAGWAYTVPQLVAMHGAGVGAFCPQYIDKIG
ncbi:DUF732 domain-containing protein [Pseudarthrobacter sp. O4]|uniref:DUF732 domain-containing protein n=1 Tax=Pseudarthrobacter sp. O4 TaxID=3418417 RepID=UPI003CF75F66